MTENNKIYITENEFAEMPGVSVGHVYKHGIDVNTVGCFFPQRS